MLNGAEGLNGTVASLASQGLAILKSLHAAMPSATEAYDGELVPEAPAP